VLARNRPRRRRPRPRNCLRDVLVWELLDGEPEEKGIGLKNRLPDRGRGRRRIGAILALRRRPQKGVLGPLLLFRSQALA
jgi:hypothetical protein